MEMPNSRHAVAFHVDFTLRTPLLLLTGDGNEVLDNTIDKTPVGDKLHINGYVWASLLRRALKRTRGGERLAEKIGKYDARLGVSPLWCEASFVELPGRDSRPGIMIDRKWGAVATGALYGEETVPSGIQVPLDFTWFVPQKENDAEVKVEEYKKMLVQEISSALWVIDDGIENIGAGWSYGFGRLEFSSGKSVDLTLSEPAGRDRLFKPMTGGLELKLPDGPPEQVLPWKKIRLPFKIADGQLLAVHTKAPHLDAELLRNNLPDAFVFRSLVYDPETKKISPRLVIPGKAVRQALFSREIERRLRTCKQKACPGSSQGGTTAGKKDICDCKRCTWFGATEKSGIIAVLDAQIDDGEANASVLHRIQLCEHSAQNMNLFAGEYLTAGGFASEVIIDQSRKDSEPDELERYIARILHEMMPGQGPSGWHRIGATSTCTGQLTLKKWPDNIEEVNDESI